MLSPGAGDVSKTAALLEGKELTKAQELVYELKIGQVMTREVIWVSPEQTMGELMEVLRQVGVAGAPVLEQGRLVGVISVQDLIQALKRCAIDDQVRQWMTTDLATVREDASVVEAVKTFAQRPVSRLPVVNREGELVGILTGGDITRGLLRALDLGYRQEEISKYRASHVFEDIVSEDTSLSLRYRVPAGDLSQGGEAASKVKRALQRLGGRPRMVRRVAVAAYEAEMNIVIHSERGGELVLDVRPERVRMIARDDGPGIPDVQAALEPGFSTAPDWIRALGFGAGMGLTNIQRYVDEFRIESEPGAGTTLDVVVYLGQEERLGRGRG